MSSVSSPQFAVECESPLRAVDGNLHLQGWIAGIAARGTSIRLRLGEDLILDCVSGIARPDVAAAFPDLAGVGTCGFKLEALIPPGLHIGTLEYQSEGCGGWTPFRSLSITADLSPLRVHLESSAPEKDSNAPWFLHGWCFHPHFTIESLTVEFAHLSATVRQGDPRPDVAAAFPDLPNARNSGFSGHLQLEAGRGSVRLSARLATGDVLQAQLIPTLEVSDHQLAHAHRIAAFARADCIRLPAVAAPEISIVIPIYNQLDLTLGCLESLVRHSGSSAFEVLIVDDNSEPLVRDTLGRVRGLRLFSNETNQGFVYNCNLGAHQALGKFVLFLNNDTEVSAGWLEAMIAVFRERPDAGAVGGRLVYPDGSLQEAGCIIWSDGSAWNYGRGDDPARPEYGYVRRVDYCSGACLAVPRELFLGVGGFDTRYRPAYYEDADLAFAIRAAGKQVYLQPAATIVHYEGASSGTDTRTGVKRHQVVNRATFAAKWAEVLSNYGQDAGLIDLARDRHAVGRVLVIDACALTPEMDAGSVRMFNLLKILAARGLKVTFAAENLQFHEPFSTQLRMAGVEHLGVPHVLDLRAYLRAHAFAFDVIVLSRKHVAIQLVDIIREVAPGTKIVFDTVDLVFLRLARQAEVEKAAKLREAAAASRRDELELCRKCDLTYVVSPDEAQVLAADVPEAEVAVVPLIDELRPSEVPFARRHGVLFVGGFQHPPNLDAVLYFLGEVLPLVHKHIPALEVHIVGSRTPESLKARAGDHVHIHGFVRDLTPLLEQVRLSIAPLRYGAGVKGKVNQSMSHGVPVVGTTIAVEGMHLEDGVNVLVGDDPQAFATAICRLHSDEELWRRLAKAGMENIEAHFSFRAVGEMLQRSLASFLPQSTGGLTPLPARPAVPYVPGETLRFGHGGNVAPYLATGWAEPTDSIRWAVGRSATLRMKLPEGYRATRCSATVYPLIVAGRIKEQRVEVVIPVGAEPAQFTIRVSEPTRLTFSLPPAASDGGALTLQFALRDAHAPSDLGLSGDLRLLSVAFIDLAVS